MTKGKRWTIDLVLFHPNADQDTCCEKVLSIDDFCYFVNESVIMETTHFFPDSNRM